MRQRLLPKRTLLLISALCVGVSVYAKHTPSKSDLQLSNTLFIENKGQLKDQFGENRRDIDYTVNAAANFKMFVGNGKIQYQWSHVENTPDAGEKPSNDIKTSYYVMNVSLEGANPKAQMVSDDVQSYSEHYYINNTNGISARSFNKVTYRNVYKNIDWVLYSSNNGTGIKYDFIVHPGGNPKDIRIKYDGAKSLKIENGALVASTPMGSITEAAPVSYGENKQPVSSNYTLTDNILSFETGKYSGKLTIDPVLKWGTYYGGDNFTLGNGVASDTFGSVFLCGVTQSTTAISTTTGMYQTSYGGGNYDGFLVKFNPDGTRAWATYYGAAGADFINAVTCDKLGNVIIAGHTSSGSGLSTSGAQQPLNASQLLITIYDYDAFVAKFAPNGTIIWGTFMGGLYSEECYTVTTDALNNIYIGGLTLSANNIATSGAFLNNPAAGFLVKYDASGARQWGTYIRGTVFNTATDINNNIFICGSTQDTVTTTGRIAGPGSHQNTIGGGFSDGFFMKFNGNGAKQLGSYYGGYNTDEVRAIATDPSGSFYIGGRTLSPTAIATTGSAQPNYSGASPQQVYDGFIVQFNPAGVRQWGTYVGDSLGQDNISSMNVATDNMLWVFGTTGSKNNIATAGAYQTVNAGPPPSPIPSPLQYLECDGFAMRMTATGGKKWGTYYGGSGWEYDVKGVIVRNKIYLAGSTVSTSAIAINGHQNTFGTSTDPRAFLAQFEADTNVAIAMPFVDTNLCAGDSLYVKYLTMTDFGRTPLGFPLNTFTIQLSDSAGNFTTPVNIGSINSFHSDFVPCKIPATTYEAKKYRIRIIASNPRDTFYHVGPNISIWQYHKPYAGIYATRDTICENTAINLDDFNSFTWPYAYTWVGPNGFTSFTHNAIVPATLVNASYTGNYIVEANNNGCKMKDTVFVTVGMSPSAPKILGDTSVCLGTAMRLKAFCDSPGVSYVWQDPTLASPSLTDSLTIPSVTMTDDGDYRLTAISALGCPSPTIKRRVNIRPLPDPVISNVDPLCSGATLSLNVNDTAASTTYAWNGPGGFSSTSKSPVITNTTTSQSGKYIVTNTNKYGCTANDTIDVLIKPLPNQVDATNNGPLCSTNNLQLTANNPTTGAGYAWTGPNGYSSTTQNPVITGVAAAASGVYTVTVDLNGCTKSDTTRVTIYPTPEKPVITGNTPLYVGEILRLKVENPQTGTDYLWLGPNNFSAPTLTPSVNSVLKSMAGYYKVTATIGTCSSSDSILVEVLEKPEQAGKVLFAFPNPNKGTFTIVASVSSDKDVEIGIFDTGGKLVHSEKATPKNKKLEHTVYTWGKLASGVYRVNVLIDGKVETISLTVQL